MKRFTHHTDDEWDELHDKQMDSLSDILNLCNVENQNALYIPYEIIIYNYIIFLISLIVLVGVGAVLKVKLTVYVFQAIIPLTLLFIMTLGVGLILATLSVFFKDLEYLWGVALMLIMYASAIFYQVDKVINNGYGFLFKINPLYMIITNFRECVLFGQPLSMEHLIPATIFSFGSLIVGVIVFFKKQDDFILHI